jgi:uncharacterized protein
MISLTSDECRVLGVIVEKAQTVASQYPITLNALITGCNQKNNRHPVTSLDEGRVLDAIDGLREKKLVSEVMLSGSRVSKYRHLARETLAVSTLELIILVELLLRGPQSIGEVRGNASRMHPIESLDAAKTIVAGMMTPQGERPALVKEVPAPPGSRGTRFVQLLCADLHRLDAPGAAGAPAQDDDAGGSLAERVAALEEQVRALTEQVRSLTA